MAINPVKGTHDLIGDEARQYSYIESKCMEIAELFNYKEIRTPIIEHTPLFIRGVGESSDVVTKEMYTFLDKGERSLTLRPELTSGVMRSIVSNKLYANADLPLKYFYCGPCFRYERPQAGRYRQFNQFGVEAVGVTSYYHDAEVIYLGMVILAALGFENVRLVVNSLGDEQSRASYRKALKEYFAKHLENMCPDCKHRFETNPLRILDCKVPSDREIIKNAPKMSDYLSEDAKNHLNNVISALTDLEVYGEIDDGLVRGLDYYTGVVFEYYIEKEGLDNVGAIGGGGHYAKLLKDVGGPDLEGVGLSFGVERLHYMWKNIVNNEKMRFLSGPDFYIMSMSEDIIQRSFNLADFLRSHDFSVDMNYEVKSMKTLFKVATRMEAKFAIIIGEDEIDKKIITVKNLRTQEQRTVDLETMVNDLQMLIHNYMSEFFKDED